MYSPYIPKLSNLLLKIFFLLLTVSYHILFRQNPTSFYLYLMAFEIILICQFWTLLTAGAWFSFLLAKDFLLLIIFVVVVLDLLLLFFILVKAILIYSRYSKQTKKWRFYSSMACGIQNVESSCFMKKNNIFLFDINISLKIIFFEDKYNTIERGKTWLNFAIKVVYWSCFPVSGLSIRRNFLYTSI